MKAKLKNVNLYTQSDNYLYHQCVIFTLDLLDIDINIEAVPIGRCLMLNDPLTLEIPKDNEIIVYKGNNEIYTYLKSLLIKL